MLRSLAVGASLLLAANVANAATTTCKAGAHIIVARASGEMVGEGIIGLVASMVKNSTRDSDSVAVEYPATLSDYQTSEQLGVEAMKLLLTSYVDACPNGKVVLMGYSQGAQVIGDVLIGTQDRYFTSNITDSNGVAMKYIDAVVAAIQMGDPSHVVDQPGSVGNATKDGIFPRTNAAAYTGNGLEAKLQSYCDANDVYCSSGNVPAVHRGYVGEYGRQAANFVVSKLAAAGVGASTSAAPNSTTLVSPSAAPTVSMNGTSAGGASVTAAPSGSMASSTAGSVSSSTHSTSFTAPGYMSYSALGSDGNALAQSGGAITGALMGMLMFAAGMF